ncbi:hypothetical protein Tco_1227620 [Tanacetum coccineum]
MTLRFFHDRRGPHDKSKSRLSEVEFAISQLITLLFGHLVIQNANSKKRISIGKDGVVRILPPVSAAEIHAVEKERKAKQTILNLWPFPRKHLRSFMEWDDWQKKFRKLYRIEGLEKGYDRFQQLLLQLRMQIISFSDLCPCLVIGNDSMRIQPDVDIFVIDDLYNNLKVFEQELTSTSKSFASAQNVAFVSTQQELVITRVKSGNAHPRGQMMERRETHFIKDQELESKNRISNCLLTMDDGVVNWGEHTLEDEPVQLIAVRQNVNSIRPNVNTGRANVNSVRQNVNSVRSNVNTGKTKQPIHTCNSNSFSPVRPQGNWGTAVKTSAGYNWRKTRPNSNCNSGSNFIRTDHPLKNIEDIGIFDSGCSGHMTGNKDHLDDFEECKGGSVTFGGSKGYITGKGRIRVGFAEIVVFLKGSHIRYALTHNPTIHDSLVKQFWQTATASTLADGTLELRATIDTLEYTITEASVRSQADQAGTQSQPSSFTVPPPPTSQHVPTESTTIPQTQAPTHTHEANTGHLLEKDLKQTMGNAIVKLVKKVKKMEKVLKSRRVVLTDSEDEAAENSSKQGRNLQKDESEVFDTPKQGKSSGETNISPQGLEAAKTLAEVLSQIKTKRINVKTEVRRRLDVEDVSTGFEDVSTSFEDVSTGVKKLVLVVNMLVLVKEKEIQYLKRLLRPKEQRNKLEKSRLVWQKEIVEYKGSVQEAAQFYTEEDWDTIRAKLEANADLVKEIAGEDVSEVDYAQRMVGLIRQEKKTLLPEQKATSSRDKPMTQAQQRQYMATYLKNQAWKGLCLWIQRKKEGKETSECLNEFPRKLKSDTREDVYVPKEKDKERSRPAPAKIVKWQIIKTGKRGAYQIIREDNTDVVYVNFQGLLNDLTRDDLKELYRLMMLKYGDNRPEEEFERVLWGDLKTMFDPPSEEDAIWKLPHQQKVLSWRYFHSCAVHCLTLEAAHIYMLTEVKYPLPPRVCKAMLEKKLLGDRKDEVCYQLLKLIEKQAQQQ